MTRIPLSCYFPRTDRILLKKHRVPQTQAYVLGGRALLVLLVMALPSQGQIEFQEIAEVSSDARGNLPIPQLSGGNVAWNEADAIRVWDGSSIQTVIDSSTTIPGHSRQFDGGISLGSFDQGVISFISQTSPAGPLPQIRGVYQYDGINVTTVADRSTVSPSTGNPLSVFMRLVRSDGTDVAFVAKIPRVYAGSIHVSVAF